MGLAWINRKEMKKMQEVLDKLREMYDKQSVELDKQLKAQLGIVKVLEEKGFITSEEYVAIYKEAVC